MALAESFLSSPEPLRSSLLITTATELGNQQSRIKPHGVMPGRLFAFPAGAMAAGYAVARTGRVNTVRVSPRDSPVGSLESWRGNRVGDPRNAWLADSRGPCAGPGQNQHQSDKDRGFDGR